MPQLYDGDHIDEDLDRIRADTHYASDADLISVFLNELDESENAKWKLCRWKDESSSPWFNCQAVVCFHDSGLNIYRIRPLSSRLSRYRIIYAYDSECDDFYLLAVVVKVPHEQQENYDLEKFYNYEPHHPISTRVVSEYRALGLPSTH